MPKTVTPPRASVVLSRDALAAALAAVAPVLRRTTTTTLPVLHTVRWDGASLTATDLDVTVSAPLPGERQEGWPAVCLHGQTLAKLVNTLPKGEVALAWSETEATLTAKGDRFKLAGVRAEEFPLVPMVDGPNLTISAGVLLEMLAAVRTALALGELATTARPLLTGVHAKERDGALVLEASDGHRLVQYTSEVKAPKGLTACLPGPSVTALVGLLATSEGEVTVTAEPARLAVDGPEGWRLVTRLVEGSYPEVERIIPQHNDRLVCRLEPGEWNAALARVAVLAEDVKNRVQVEIGQDRVTMRTEHQDRGSGSAGAPCETEGAETVTVPLHARWLRDMLTHLPTDTDGRLTIRIGKEKDPIRFEGAPGVIGLMVPVIDR